MLVAWWAARSLYGSQIGFAAALALTGAPLWILGSNLTTTDIGVGALLGSAVLVFAVAFQKSDSRLYPVVWLLVGLAFLAKGLIAVVLPAATLLAYACLTRQYASFLSAKFWRWSLLALLVSTPWLAIVSLRNPEFLNYFFIHEHFARFSSSIHERDKPFWFFIVVTLVGVLPFAGLLPRTFALNPKNARISRSFDSRLFLSLWVLVVLVFFSLSKSKLPLYILPAFPPLAVLIAQAAMSAAPSTLGMSFLSMPVLGAAIGLLLWHPTLSAVLLKRELSNPSVLHYWGGITMLILVIGGLISFATATRGRPLRAYAIASLATLASLQAGLMASRAFDSLSIKPIGLQAKAASRSDTELFNVGQIDRGLAFYSEMAPVIVGARSELDMGFDVEPSKWIPNEDAFVKRWQSPGHKLAVMRTETFQRLQSRLGNETTQLSRNGANVLVQRQ